MNITVDDSISIFSSTYKEEIKEFKDDPMVLACSLKELVETQQNFYPLDDLRVIENITEEIRELAERVRKYYTKKFFWQNLTGNGKLSDYRSRVCYLLENHVRTCKEQDVGIYYKLPYFYQEDMAYEDFKQRYNTTDVPRVMQGVFPARSTTKSQLKLTYLKTTTSRQKKRNLHRFWFTEGTYLFNIEITNDNPLLEMFTQLVVEKMTITLDTYYNVDRLDQMYFYKLYKFSLTKETDASFNPNGC